VPEPITLTVELPVDQFDALARRVAELLSESRDDGFLDVAGAAEYLALTPKAVRHKVERGQLPHHRVGRRVLFDRAELREWVGRG
jgi:excisionase family DNA binding protein